MVKTLYYRLCQRVGKRDLIGGERQYDDLDVHVHPFALGGYEIARADEFGYTRHMMHGYVKNRQPMLFRGNSPIWGGRK